MRRYSFTLINAWWKFTLFKVISSSFIFQDKKFNKFSSNISSETASTPRKAVSSKTSEVSYGLT